MLRTEAVHRSHSLSSEARLRNKTELTGKNFEGRSKFEQVLLAKAAKAKADAGAATADNALMHCPSAGSAVMGPPEGVKFKSMWEPFEFEPLRLKFRRVP